MKNLQKGRQGLHCPALWGLLNSFGASYFPLLPWIASLLPLIPIPFPGGNICMILEERKMHSFLIQIFPYFFFPKCIGWDKSEIIGTPEHTLSFGYIFVQHLTHMISDGTLSKSLDVVVVVVIIWTLISY